MTRLHLASAAALKICCAITNFQNEGAINAIRALGGQTADANDPFAREHFANKDSVNEVDDWGVSVQVDHDLGFANLTSITAYRNNETFFDSDSDFSTLEILETVSTENKIGTFTQELRLTSNIRRNCGCRRQAGLGRRYTALYRRSCR